MSCGTVVFVLAIEMTDGVDLCMAVRCCCLWMYNCARFITAEAARRYLVGKSVT
jgi:hypothetical protein